MGPMGCATPGRTAVLGIRSHVIDTREPLRGCMVGIEQLQPAGRVDTLRATLPLGCVGDVRRGRAGGLCS
jgi:stage III sporulation protein SpoIIIAA